MDDLTNPNRLLAEKPDRRLVLRTVLVVVATLLGAAVLYLAAGDWGWLLAAILTSGIALIAYLRHEANAQVLRGRSSLIARVSDSIPGLVYQCRLYPSGRCALVYANEALSWVYEKDFAEVEQDCSPILKLVHPDDFRRLRASLKDSALRLTPWKGEYRVTLPRQGLRWRFAQATVERLKDGSTLWSGFIVDITARKEAEEILLAQKQREADALREAHLHEKKKTVQLSRVNKTLLEESTHDHLTGVYLRRHFDRRFPEIFEECRLKRPITLIFCDIDFFKAYNDTFGHLAGDRCLSEVARVLDAQVNRKGQIFARYGGEEFVAVLPGLSSQRAGIVAEEMRRVVEDLAIEAPGGDGQRVTVSIGVASMNNIPNDIASEVLLSTADGALYAAKREGRNRVCLQVLESQSSADPSAALIQN